MYLWSYNGGISRMSMDKRYRYDDVVVILTYRNTEDIIQLLKSIKTKIKNSRCIIVNSYYDDDTRDNFQRIALENDCDFLSVENKGYGAGNNAGIKYALDNYETKRIIISNPDIEINEYDQEFLNSMSDAVFGGVITNLKGKKQNPLRVFDWEFTNESNYYLLTKKNKYLFYASVVIAKLQRNIFLLLNTKCSKVFAIHGSFLVISSNVLKIIGTLFDENIFMYGEEIDIAKVFKHKNIPVYFTSHINVTHKEDGDISISNLNHSSITRDSCNYIHNKWKKRG